MPPRSRPRVTHAPAARYLSSSCLIGTHGECTQSVTAAAPAGIPVIYEACSCSCHPVTAVRRDRMDVPR